MTNPFENKEGTYLVLINDEGQYSLWPASIAIPPGWNIAFAENTRSACLDYINAHWIDMRPNSLKDGSLSKRDNDYSGVK
ncbi:MbtH family protein [Parageobacillus thermoglucosidasius]|uniref:Protein mbtH n=3 Tax=Anoxybacillaceae TaxID=3120669 RepID=A0AAN0YLT5_PARTM|nr:MbtH family protein [Parageobacillus thermoglucosidasius]AEH46250.1 MbtH domain protein [Parageobacillus thermoglucosidasius C56-YS93]ALF08919.1 protein mbtH [Parageobacillus thermoglucosidasius]ANZ29001.1 protein mbtH [Parageobacillus thermoglucosidasius]APM79740.1 protein mbtH [Parageobacillus thermoglucosidasius]KJX69508.1 protein mbtH [Parageobacillus thermoglucosidasius]